jgi:DNA mismatch repair protein MutL
MAKIQVLDQRVSELIAAGEVIERPASIVKELLENAIDAKATAVTVEIKRGGIEFIRISDNGIGIQRDDVATAFLRHATSKVHNKQDLEHIATLGFRGEALASVCAVSKVEMITKPAGEELGRRIVLHGGKQISLEDAGCPEGTTILVRDLFYNVPARLKFLKRDFTEGNAVQSIVEKIALSHPEISFRFIKDNKSIFYTSGDNQLISAVHSVFGKDFSHALLPVSYSYHGVDVNGFVTKTTASRSNRAMQHFFVNGRYVRSRTCMAALEEAYKHLIMVSRFPGCVLKIGLDFSKVDVNVHPAKTEIRFTDEKTVFEAVYFAVKSALDQEDILKKEPVSPAAKVSTAEFRNQPAVQEKITMQNISENLSKDAGKTANHDSFLRVDAKEFQTMIKQSPKQVHTSQPQYDTVQKKQPFPTVFKPQEPIKQTEPAHLDSDFQFLKPSAFEKKQSEIPVSKAAEKPAFDMAEEEQMPEISIRMIGEVFKTYVLFETDDLFIMMDKHAAHERILFEKLRRQIHLRDGQLLLIPLSLSLTVEEIDTIITHRELFAQFGFTFQIDGKKVQVTQAPLILHRYPLSEIVEGMAKDMMNSHVDLTPAVFEDLLHSMACRAAMKANEDNSSEELEELAKQVYYDQKIRHCPHGRPVGITMTKYEIEKKFGRHN